MVGNWIHERFNLLIFGETRGFGESGSHLVFGAHGASLRGCRRLNIFVTHALTNIMCKMCPCVFI